MRTGAAYIVFHLKILLQAFSNFVIRAFSIIAGAIIGGLIGFLLRYVSASLFAGAPAANQPVDGLIFCLG
mgnify:CR=1 FL=1